MVATGEIRLRTDALRAAIPSLKAGDRLLLSGTVYTARDAAHKRMFEALSTGEALPFPLTDSVIYYSGATPAPAGLPIGSCGPTTSSRMDVYADELYRRGMVATIGKGERSPAVCAAIRETGGIYLCAIGGAGALAAQHVTSCEVVAYPDLGCEAVKRLTLTDFPLIVAIDCHGGSLFA